MTCFNKGIYSIFKILLYINLLFSGFLSPMEIRKIQHIPKIGNCHLSLKVLAYSPGFMHDKIRFLLVPKVITDKPVETAARGSALL